MNLPIHLQGKDELIVYLCGGYYDGPGHSGQVYGPNGGWDDSRDLEICKQLNQALGFGVLALAYQISSSFDATLLFYKPLNWILSNVYTFAKAHGYSKVHLVGFSGGGSVASSQLLYYADPIVEDLILISGYTARNPKAVHANAAYYAENIHVPTLLIYGKQDALRNNADVWLQHNTAKLIEYEGGHDYGPFMALLVPQIIDFLGGAPVPPPPTPGRKILVTVTVNGVPMTLTLTENQAQQVTITATAQIQD